MAFLNHKMKKYLMLLPVVFLILNALYYQYAVRRIQDTMLQEKNVEICDTIDMLSAAVDATPERKWYDHEENIIGAMEDIDRLYQVYGAAYKTVDGELVLITDRVYETTIFDPLDYPEFVNAIKTQDSGDLIIGYTPENQTYRELHLHFQWMPLYSGPDERYLVVGGVSKYSIITKIPVMVSVGQWVSMAITFIINAWLIILIVRLGYIYVQRKGDKWRNRRK